MHKSNKTSSVLRLIGVQPIEYATNNRNEEISRNLSNLSNQTENNENDSEVKITAQKKSRRKTVVKNTSVKKLVGGAVPNPAILNIGTDEPAVYRRIGNERQIVNVSALLISEQLGSALERFNSCSCDACCRIITEKAMAIMPDCFIHVNNKTDENHVNNAIRELRPEAVKILTKLCITFRTKPFHNFNDNK